MSIVSPYGFRQLKLRGVLAAVGGCMLWALSASSWSIGLGKIQLESHLNEPLRAIIPIEDSAGLRSSEVRASIASKAEYNDLGIAWSDSLESLVLRVVSEQTSLLAGSSELIGLRLELTSISALDESNLNLVVQFNWPNGQLVRDYALHLDLPFLTMPADPRGPVLESDLAPSTDNKFETQIHGIGLGNFGLSSLLTQSGDTLWEIALANRGDRSVSVQEMMIAIQFVNPEVFIDQNINLLKVGYRLEMPNEQDFDNFNAAEAFSKVDDQNRAQNIGIKEKNLESVSSENDKLLDVGSLLTVKPAHGVTEVFEEAATGVELLNGQTMLTLALPVNEVLEERVAVLEAQLADMTNAISAKDQQIVTLQRQSRELAEVLEPDNDTAFVHPVTLIFGAGLIVLVVVMLLMSARYRRLIRAARATPIARQGESMTVSSEGNSLLNEDEDPASMLDLARAYIDMGEPASARKLLARVQVIGVASEIEEAEKMLAGLSSS